MGNSGQRRYVRTGRRDDFRVASCPDDPEFQAPLLPLGNNFGAKVLAVLAINRMLPMGSIVEQYGVYYEFYAGHLYEVTRDTEPSDFPWTLVDEIPRFYPELDDNGEGRWVAYDA